MTALAGSSFRAAWPCCAWRVSGSGIAIDGQTSLSSETGFRTNSSVSVHSENRDTSSLWNDKDRREHIGNDVEQ